MRNSLIFGALFALTTAQAISSGAISSGAVTSLFFPLAGDAQNLVASVVNTGPNNVKTLVIGCPAGTPDNDCGFQDSFTVTAGPSTIHWKPTDIYMAYGELDCKVTGTLSADCAFTQGQYNSQFIETRTETGPLTIPAASSTTTSTVVSGTDMVFLTATITAGPGIGAGSVSSGSTTSGPSISNAMGLPSATTSVVSTKTGNSAQGTAGMFLSGAAMGLLALPMLVL